MSNLIQQFTQSSHIAGGNAAFVEDLYESWLANPASVEPVWQHYFQTLKGREAGDVPHSAVMTQIASAAKQAGRGTIIRAADSDSHKQAAVLKMVTAYRSRGHLQAKLDPLDLAPLQPAPDLDLPFHGLSPEDLATQFRTNMPTAPQQMTLKALMAHLQATYCGSIGAEFMHIAEADQRRWMYERLEAVGDAYPHKDVERKRILDKLTAGEGLERFLHTKYVGQKRFSLEGGESLIPLMDTLIYRAADQDVKEMVIGMAHRGRLNVLINTLGKPPHQLFAEFEGKHEGPVDATRSGDVKYHMGYSSDVKTAKGSIHLTLGFNPSHLEIIDPVIAGSVRARQTRRGDETRDSVVPVLIHGDAAFAGQGVVMELLQMSQARGFAVGGTLHVVINNQVGFTTHRVDDARSTLYCTDVAKMVGAPILHVNGDDPDAVVFCAQLALDFRQRFNKDVVIDLICYRRHGHNEADEPAATQPLMYQNIRARKTTREVYAEALQSDGVLSAEEARTMVDKVRAQLDRGEGLVDLAAGVQDKFAVDFSAYLNGELSDPCETGVLRKTIDALAVRLNTLDTNLKLHPRVAKIYEDRLKMAAGELPMDWGFAETLAYASLIQDGFKLRLVGQDANRGTFFHRHAALHDQITGETTVPLRQLAKRSEDVTIIDSLLSEEAVMAYEYGYATADPTTLVIWEGQFGDFANGAQVVIDQFISSGEAKWGRLCGLALFLPHGYEGQGPEHSSARLERFLQLCALNNMQVCVPTTPAQMFHMIRRQMKRRARKPLVVMTPKSMLRHKLSVSNLDALSSGSFQNIIPDHLAKDPKKVKRVVLCSGKVYYDLLEEYERRGIKDVAIARVEQLYPFPRELLISELKRFPKAKDVVWCQEEPQNQGAWYQIQHHLRFCLQSEQMLHYAGRSRSAAPACGHHATHAKEQALLVESALVSKLNGDEAVE